MVKQVSSVSAADKKKLIKAGKWFVYAGKLFATEKAKENAIAATTGNKSGGKPKPKSQKVNTSAGFWADKPGAREIVECKIVIEKTPAELKCLRFGADLYGSAVGVGATAWTPRLPPVGELTGITVEVECGLFNRDVKIQAVVVAVEEIASVAGLDWAIIKKIDRKSALKMEDIQSTDSVHRVPVLRPNNSSSTTPTCLAAMFRAVDSDNPSTEKAKFTIVAKFSVLKAGSSGIRL